MTGKSRATDLAAQIAVKRAELAELQRQARLARQTEKAEPRRVRFTKSTVRALPIPSDRTVTYWDRDVVGLGVRVSPAGGKVYFLQCRTRVGRAIKITLGRADRISAEQAKESARRHLAALALGRDPAAELREQRKIERERRQAQTIDQLWHDFAANHLAGKRAKTVAAYSSWYRQHIRPTLGRSKIGNVTKTQVERLHKATTEAGGRPTANRVVAVLSSLLSYAVDRGLVAANVCRGAVKRHKEPPRERTLSDSELAGLIAHLAASPAVEARLCEFALATGCRKGEALALTWSDVNGAWWTVPASVSKSHKAVRRPLNAAAIAVLDQVERRGALVFGGTNEGRLSKWWLAQRKQIGLADLHLHDLRHAAASMAINAGVPLAAVGKMLGHGVNSASMTARYSHVHDQQLTMASAAVAERLELLRKATPAGRA